MLYKSFQVWWLKGPYTRLFIPPYRWEIKDLAPHYKAAGIITSGIREITMKTRLDVPDVVHYYSFWGEKGSGFILSPREGEPKKIYQKREEDENNEKEMKAEKFIRRLRTLIHDNDDSKVVFFLGAGCSVSILSQ